MHRRGQPRTGFVLLGAILCFVVLRESIVRLNMRPGVQVPAGRPGVQVPGQVEKVVVAHRAVSWWVLDLGAHWQVPCSFEGKPLECQYVSTAHASGNSTAQDLLGQAQALVLEDCWDPATVPARFQNVTQVMFSMEPVTLQPCLDNQVADMEMTYRSCSQVIIPACIGVHWDWGALGCR